jgi:hypothetical protein
LRKSWHLFLAACYRPNDPQRFLAAGYLIRQRLIGRFVGKVLHTSEIAAETPSPEAEESEEALPQELTAQLDAFLQSQIYSEEGSPEGAAPGLVLLVDTPEGTYLNAAGYALEQTAQANLEPDLEATMTLIDDLVE